ncbi:ABC transporter permease [Halodesulfovibrio aestuarii]|uniref:ABC transporter permease n=1 Tax=Halodesulfovibrio aestuarii TaxID=126333 RepID=A0ABV4JQF2_9BACT
MQRITTFLYWVRAAALFLIRSWRSSLVIGVMLTTAIMTLVFLSALAMGVSDTMIENSTSLYFGQIALQDVPEDVSTNELKVDGVRTILKRYSVTGLVEVNKNVAGLQLIGVSPEEELKNTALWKKTIAGTPFDSQKKGVFIGSGIADKLLVSVGDTLSFRTNTQSNATSYTVIGIFKTGLSQFDNTLAFCNKKDLSQLPDNYQGAVFLQQGRQAEPIANTIRKIVPNKATVLTWGELMPDLQQLVELNSVCMDLVNAIVLAIVSIGVSCAFVIFILRNIREFGIMKSMGVTHWELINFISIKIIMINVVSCALGVLAGSIAVIVFADIGIDLSQLTSHNQYFLTSGMIYPRLTLSSLIYPPIMAISFSIAAGLWPALIVVRQDPAEILRKL